MAFCGCGSVTVKTAAEDNFNPAKYKTYAIKKPSRDFNPAEFSAENQARVRDALGEELARRGLRPSDNPDLWLGLYLRVKSKHFDLDHATTEGDSMADIMKNHYGFVFGSGKSLNQQQTIPYREGTLVVDAVDAKSDRIVWQGTASGALYTNRSDEAVEKRIREAVTKMFAHFR